MSEDSPKIIKKIEQWKWSEMQGLELLSAHSDSTPASFKASQSPITNPFQQQVRETELSGEERREMEVSEAKKAGGGDGEKPGSAPPSAGFGELFRFADGLDYVLMAMGSVGAIVHGSSLPLFLRFFADLVNSFGSNADDLDKMTQDVVKMAKLRRKRKLELIISLFSEFALGNFMHYMATFVSGFVVGFTAVWQLALVTLAVVPVIAVIAAIHTNKLAKLSSKSQEALSQAGNIAEQTIAQIRTVLAFVGESRALQAYSSALKVVQRLGYKSGFVKGMGLGATYFTVFCCYALLLWYGGYLVRHHYTNGGLAIATMFAVMLGGIALGQSAPSMAAFAKARVAAARIFCIIDHRPGVERNNESGLELDSVMGQVELKNVDFSYPSRPEVPVLSDFSLSVPAGKTIALVGSSGSGKSTVVSLIERFYDPTSGQVLLDGNDIKTLKLRWLRQQIGLVSQEPALFATTIKENILLGRPAATLDEIEEAARVANAHSFIIKLPDGYDTQRG
ncbi:Multidrug resistance protein 1 [Sarracenia purpurea var. burkii]